MLLANQFTVSLASGNQVSTVKLTGGAGRLVHARGSVHSTRSARPTRTSPSPAPPHRARTRGRARQPVRANQKTASWRGKSSSMTRPSKAERCPRDQTRANRPRYRSSGTTTASMPDRSPSQGQAASILLVPSGCDPADVYRQGGRPPPRPALRLPRARRLRRSRALPFAESRSPLNGSFAPA